MYDKGHIIVKREIKNWGWYSNSKVFTVFVHLLIEANWKDGKWEDQAVKRGEIVTSISDLATMCGLSMQEVRTCMRILGGAGEVLSRRVGRRSILTICHYDDYQDAQQDANMSSTSSQQDDNKSSTSHQQSIIEQGNNGTKKQGKKKHTYPDSVERIYALYPSSTVRADGTTPSLRTSPKDKDKIERLLSSGEYNEESLSDAIRKYLAQTKPEYIKLFQSFLNQIPDFSESPGVLFREKKWKVRGERYSRAEVFKLVPDNNAFLAIPPELRMALNEGKEIMWDGDKFVIAAPEE